MLDWLEARGFDLDSLDSGHSMRLHCLLWPSAPPQSICSSLVERGSHKLIWLLGRNHCHRSYARYH